MRMPSERSKRWFVPPPVRTAYFSSDAQARRRLAGVAEVAVTAFEQDDDRGGGAGDAAEVREEVQRDTLGAQNRPERALDGRDGVAGRDADRLRPSVRSTSSFGSTCAKVASASGRPARTPSAWAVMDARPDWSDGTSALVVMSSAAWSSSRAASLPDRERAPNQADLAVRYPRRLESSSPWVFLRNKLSSQAKAVEPARASRCGGLPLRWRSASRRPG